MKRLSKIMILLVFLIAFSINVKADMELYEVCSPGVDCFEDQIKDIGTFSADQDYSFSITVENTGSVVIQEVHLDSHLKHEFGDTLFVFWGERKVQCSGGSSSGALLTLSPGETGTCTYDFHVYNKIKPFTDYEFTGLLATPDGTVLFEKIIDVNVVNLMVSLDLDIFVINQYPETDGIMNPGEDISVNLNLIYNENTEINLQQPRIVDWSELPCSLAGMYNNECDVISKGSTEEWSCLIPNYGNYGESKAIIESFAIDDDVLIGISYRFSFDVNGYAYCMNYLAPQTIEPEESLTIEYNTHIEMVAKFGELTYFFEVCDPNPDERTCDWNLKKSWTAPAYQDGVNSIVLDANLFDLGLVGDKRDMRLRLFHDLTQEKPLSDVYAWYWICYGEEGIECTADNQCCSSNCDSNHCCPQDYYWDGDECVEGEGPEEECGIEGDTCNVFNPCCQDDVNGYFECTYGYCCPVGEYWDNGECIKSGIEEPCKQGTNLEIDGILDTLWFYPEFTFDDGYTVVYAGTTASLLYVLPIPLNNDIPGVFVWVKKIKEDTSSQATNYFAGGTFRDIPNNHDELFSGIEKNYWTADLTIDSYGKESSIDEVYMFNEEGTYEMDKDYVNAWCVDPEDYVCPVGSGLCKYVSETDYQGFTNYETGRKIKVVDFNENTLEIIPPAENEIIPDENNQTVLAWRIKNNGKYKVSLDISSICPSRWKCEVIPPKVYELLPGNYVTVFQKITLNEEIICPQNLQKSIGIDVDHGYPGLSKKYNKNSQKAFRITFTGRIKASGLVYEVMEITEIDLNGTILDPIGERIDLKNDTVSTVSDSSRRSIGFKIPIPNAEVLFIDEDGNEYTVLTDNKGEFKMMLSGDETYELLASKIGYLSKEKEVDVCFEDRYFEIRLERVNSTCLPDCTRGEFSRYTCDKTCNMINGCRFFNRICARECDPGLEVTDGLVKGEITEYNETHVVKCCVGEPELPPDKLKTDMIVNSSHVIKTTRIVLFERNPIKMVVLLFTNE